MGSNDVIVNYRSDVINKNHKNAKVIVSIVQPSVKQFKTFPHAQMYFTFRTPDLCLSITILLGSW